MDPLDALLAGPRARGAFLLRCLLDPPWSVRLQDDAPLSVTAVVRGHAWLVDPGPDREAGSGRAPRQPPVRLEAGDLVVLCPPLPTDPRSSPAEREGTPYAVFCDDPATPVRAVIHPGQECRTPDGRALHEEMHQGVRSWGTGQGGATVLLTGAYGVDGELGRRLLATLPGRVVVRHGGLGSPLVDLLGTEVLREAPGQQAVLDRLLDLVLVAALRSWFAGDLADAAADGGPPRWWAAQDDPVVGPALRLMQHQPGHGWSVAGLAAAVGVSRAAFARRFHDRVGSPPMTWLAEWRLGLAADLLRDPARPDVTLATVAREVGYGSPFALSAAFTRAHGESPRAYRQRRPTG